MRTESLGDTLPIIWVDTVNPRFKTSADILVEKSQDFLIARRQKQIVCFEVPIPQTIIRSRQCYRSPKPFVPLASTS